VNIRLPLSDSIGSVMGLIQKTNEGKGLYYPCDHETSERIKSGLSHSWPKIIDQIIIMYAMDIPSVKDVPNQVKNRILDWALELERAGIHGDEHSFTQQEQKRAEQVIFNDYSTKIQTASVQGGLQVGLPNP
jgi:AbiTii